MNKQEYLKVFSSQLTKKNFRLMKHTEKVDIDGDALYNVFTVPTVKTAERYGWVLASIDDKIIPAPVEAFKIEDTSLDTVEKKDVALGEDAAQDIIKPVKKKRGRPFGSKSKNK